MQAPGIPTHTARVQSNVSRRVKARSLHGRRESCKRPPKQVESRRCDEPTLDQEIQAVTLEGLPLLHEDAAPTDLSQNDVKVS